MGISNISLKILQQANIKFTISRRRENFQYLLRGLQQYSKVKPVFRQLPEGICPLLLPILVKNRESVQKKLKDKGIEAFIFGEYLHCSLPRDEFRTAFKLSQKCLCLPIHQELTQNHLDHIIKTMSVTAQDLKVGEVAFA